MNGFKTMLKMNIRLLFRNKGYLGFVIILPVMAVLLLKIPDVSTSYATNSENMTAIVELETENQSVISMNHTRMAVKVYDGSQSELSEYFLKQLADTGIVQIYRYKMENYKVSEMEEKAQKSAEKNNLAAVICLAPDMEERILSKNPENGILLFKVSGNAGTSTLETSMEQITTGMQVYSSMAAGDPQVMNQILDKEQENAVTKEIKTISISDGPSLTQKQNAQVSNIGYTLAAVSMAFLFGGVFIANIVLGEKENKVLTRILLTDTNIFNYYLVKMILCVITVLVQMVVMAVGIGLFVQTDFGIPLYVYLLLIFFLGLVFSFLSTVAGVIMRDSLSANYFAFFVWSISAMLAGLYFPLEATSEVWKKASLFMPQRWTVKTAELIMAGQNSAYLTYILVMAGFLLVTASFGVAGIKISRKD